MKRGRRKGLAHARRILLGIMLLATVSALAYGSERMRTWVAADGRFPVDEIRITGNELLLEGEVLALALVDRGQNLFGLKSSIIEQRLVDSDWITGASLSRRPPGKVFISIRERRPWFLELREDPALVDRQGLRFPAMGKEKGIDLPILVDLTGEGMDIVRALSVISPPESDWITRSYAEITIGPDGSVTLIDMERGTRILLGTRPFSQKADRLKAVLRQWNATGQWYAELDLRFEGQAIARDPIAVSRR